VNGVRAGIVAAVIALVWSIPGFASGSDPAPALVEEINLARTDPAGYARHLREFRSRFRGRLYRLPEQGSYMRTVEGVSAVDEAIRALRRQRPLPPLAWSDGLADVAEELVDEQGETGATGHASGRRGDLQRRVERQGAWGGEIGETIYYGHRDPRLVVIQLLIDDGVRDRGHRKALLSPAYGTAGAACGPHPRYGGVCVADFAGAFREE
jgi:uncharacterized protein YkwD